jgi:ubiquinone/menaquinone biosynthesis C-methylase UbiE
MKRQSVHRAWFEQKYRDGDGRGYLRLKQDALTRIHHETALDLIKSAQPGRIYRSILDVGCACGDFTADVVREFGAGEAVGIDFAPSGLKIARQRYPHIKFVEAALPDLPVHDAQADLVLVMEVLYYLSDTDLNRSVVELARVVKSGGLVVISINLGTGVNHLEEAQVLDLMASQFTHIATRYEHCLFQQRLQSVTGRAILLARQYRIPPLRWFATTIRESMSLARVNYWISHRLIGNHAKTKGVYVFKKGTAGANA